MINHFFIATLFRGRPSLSLSTCMNVTDKAHFNKKIKSMNGKKAARALSCPKVFSEINAVIDRIRNSLTFQSLLIVGASINYVGTCWLLIKVTSSVQCLVISFEK